MSRADRRSEPTLPTTVSPTTVPEPANPIRMESVIAEPTSRHAARFETVSRAQGPYLWTASGRRFLDHSNAGGRIVIGHADPRVNRAAAEAAATSDISTLGADALESVLAHRIQRSTRSADAVAFVGSEAQAVLLAVRLAQRATGRRRLLKVASGRARPSAARRRAALNGVAGPVRVVDVGSSTSTDLRAAVPAGEYAAVIVAPDAHLLMSEDDVRRRLEAAAEVAQRGGSLLILDERASAFREHLGGYGAVASVSPPLTILGGAMGNGYGIAGVAAGRSLAGELMAWRSEAGPDDLAAPYALGAAIATHDLLATGGIRRLRRAAARLREGLTRAVRDIGIPATVTGTGNAWHLSWHSRPPNRRVARAAAARAEYAFRTSMLDAGIVLPGSITDPPHLNASFSDDDIDETLDAASGVLARMNAA